ncbi:hypothetical protein M422DRAFT_239362 [Sphaerobolus stellatus SS14]|nr:hypothetical protein M422DRAFT_239362 [Sphaerobolus stellatus SS14]
MSKSSEVPPTSNAQISSETTTNFVLKGKEEDLENYKRQLEAEREEGEIRRRNLETGRLKRRRAEELEKSLRMELEGPFIVLSLLDAFILLSDAIEAKGVDDR